MFVRVGGAVARRGQRFPRAALALALLALASASMPQQARAQWPLWDELRNLRMFSADEPLGAEDPAAEDIEPRIPEPLVFDMVRPLGARAGEWEVNTLMIVPLNRRMGRNADVLDADGVVRRRRGAEPLGWAPEIEVAVWDNFAVEFEVPFEDSSLEAYKFAAQYTFGTAFDRQYIHGTQMIVEHLIDDKITELTFLYIGGLRFNETWSTLFMAGFRADANDPTHADRHHRLLNMSLFADVLPLVTLGIEADVATSLRGEGSYLIMPQMHLEFLQRYMLQWGFGALMDDDRTLPVGAFRLIGSF